MFVLGGGGGVGDRMPPYLYHCVHVKACCRSAVVMNCYMSQTKKPLESINTDPWPYVDPVIYKSTLAYLSHIDRSEKEKEGEDAAEGVLDKDEVDFAEETNMVDIIVEKNVVDAVEEKSVVDVVEKKTVVDVVEEKNVVEVVEETAVLEVVEKGKKVVEVMEEGNEVAGEEVMEVGDGMEEL